MGGALIGSSYLDTHTQSISNQQFSAVFASRFMERLQQEAAQLFRLNDSSLSHYEQREDRGRVTHSEPWDR